MQSVYDLANPVDGFGNFHQLYLYSVTQYGIHRPLVITFGGNSHLQSLLHDMTSYTEEGMARLTDSAVQCKVVRSGCGAEHQGILNESW